MSTTIIYRARCIIDEAVPAGNVVLVQAASQDNNLHPNSGSHRASAVQKAMYTFQTLDTHDLEGAAEYFEKLARDYDGCCIREGAIRGDSGVLGGFRAYQLWSNRFAKATGIQLREPRLDHVTWGGLPDYLFSKPKPRVELKKGDDISVDKARELVQNNHQIRVLYPQYGSGQEMELRLGFISSAGDTCVYSPKSRRRGYQVTRPLKAAHSYDSWEGKPGIQHAQEVICTVTQRDEDPTGFYVSGHTDGKFGYLALRGGKQNFEWSTTPRYYDSLAGFKDQADAQRALDVINKVLPDAGAKMVTSADLPLDYFPEDRRPALAAAATKVPEPAPLPDIPSIPKVLPAGTTSDQTQLNF